jgi:hypothetical protein
MESAIAILDNGTVVRGVSNNADGGIGQDAKSFGDLLRSLKQKKN